MKLLQKINLTDEAIGELLNIDEFADKVNPDEPRIQGNGIKLTNNNGEEFRMENQS